MTLRRTRYQAGSLTTERRKGGPDVWAYRWRERVLNGHPAHRKLLVGTVDQYRTESDARRAVDALRIGINQENLRALAETMTVGALVRHYIQTELAEDNPDKAYSTKGCYESYLAKWVLPRWESYPLREVKTVAVEAWLRAIPRALGTKAKIRNIMHAVFNHAIRYEWFEKNPITLVRQSAKRQRIPVTLAIEEIQALLGKLEPMARTLVLIDAATGLRVGELLALQWMDIDFESMQLNICRSISHQVVGSCKTEASRKPVPLDSSMAEDLWRWRQTSEYNRAEDWVFASPRMKGTQPYWPDSLLRKQIRPAAERAGITKRIGWHTFRHTFSCLLRANGEDVKVVQELLRHANSRITLDLYTQAVTGAKRQAQSKVVRMILPGRPPAGPLNVPFCSQMREGQVG